MCSAAAGETAITVRDGPNSATRTPAKRRVLFLCTGNSARSQMAEGLLRRRAGQFFDVLSAGTRPRTVDPMAVKVMAEIGIDISKQVSKSLEAIKDSGTILFLIIVCANAEDECPTTFAPAGIRVSWPLEDPTVVRGESNRLKKFRDVRDQLREHIEKWLRSEVPTDWLR